MKKNILYTVCILILFLFSCKEKYNFYDIDSPLLEFYTFKKEHILFQYNEPVSSVKHILKNKTKQNELNIDNIFPVANVYIPSSFFIKKESQILQIKAIDTSGNIAYIKIPAPIININPAILQIDEIRIKYSKKRKQKIILKALKSGNTRGFFLVLFIRGKKIKIPFLFENVKKNEKLAIYITSSKEKKEYNYVIGFSQKRVNLILKNRLSQISALLFILNNKDEVLDYLLYYNSKKHSFEYYKSNKYFNKLNNELILYDIKSDLFDIAGSSTKRTIQKIGNKFYIKKH